jgi:hypothetical protein
MIENVTSTVKSKVKGAIIHPLVFAAFPILSLYVKNMGRGFLGETVRITTGVLLFTVLFWWLVSLFVKDRDKSAIVVSIFGILFFSYGHAISAFASVLDWMHLSDKGRVLVEGRPALLSWAVIWGGVFVITTCFVARSNRNLRPVTGFLNVVALALTVMVGANSAVGWANMHLAPRFRTNASQPSASSSAAVATPDGEQNNFDLTEFKNSWQQDNSLQSLNAGTLPDIYYIIVDAYARADILEEMYQFDNSEFLSYLTERGFYIADRSVANYPQTELSVPSSINFMYLDGLARQMGTETSNRQPLYVIMTHNRVVKHLRSLGYTIISFTSGYSTGIEADVNKLPPEQWDLTEFQEGLITLTPLFIFRKTWFDLRRDRTLYTLDHVADSTQFDGPCFTFVHIICPHWPFLFDADGRHVLPPRGDGGRKDYEYDELVEGYRGQLAFLNQKLRIAIDEILSQSSVPPIIILQADHGPDAKLEFDNLEETYLPERMSIFNAYYFPDQDYDTLYEHITPVNTFRVILNNYFGADYELLEDKSYFAAWDHPYAFIDVTDEVLPND